MICRSRCTSRGAISRYRHADLGRPAAYLDAIRRPDLLDHRSLTIEGRSPTGHAQHVARTFALSYEQLRPDDKTDRIALATLVRAAWLAPGEPIPRHLLRSAADIRAANEAAILRFEDSVLRLRELGLIAEQEQGTLVLHRLIAAFVRSQAGDAATTRGQVEAAVLAEAIRLNDAGYPAPLLAWQPQLRFVAEQAAEMNSMHAGSLFNSLGYHLRVIADLLGAKAACQRALAIDEKSFGFNHPHVARDVNNLGSVLRALGDLAGARAACERALANAENRFGPEHPEVAIRVNNLGRVLHDLGDLAGARSAYEHALAIDEKNFGSDHPKVAIRVNNLGGVLLALGDRASARAAFERSLPIFQKHLGPSHPNVGTLANNLGSVLRELGDTAGARAAYERALAIFERSLGPEHPRTRTVRGNLESLGGG